MKVYLGNKEARIFIRNISLMIEKGELEKGDVIITSPPYNNGTKYVQYNDKMDMNEFWAMLFESFLYTDRVTKDDAIMFINFKEPIGRALEYRIGLSSLFYSIEKSTDWKYVQRLVWFMPNKQQINPMKNKTFFTSYTEDIFFFAKKDAFEKREHLLNKSNIGIPLSDAYLNDKRYEKSRERMISEYGKLFKDIGDFWVVPIYKYNRSLKKHNPAEYPIELAEMAIKSHKDYGKRELIVIDPFVGGGSTIIAALRNGCSVYACDVSEHYINVCKERIKNEGLQESLVIID